MAAKRFNPLRSAPVAPVAVAVAALFSCSGFLAASRHDLASGTSDRCAVLDRIAGLVRAARLEAGLEPLERREAATRTATARARQRARLGDAGALGDAPPLASLLDANGLSAARSAFEHVVLERGHADPASLAFRSVELSTTAFSRVLDPAADALGVGEAETAEGSHVIVLLVLQDPPSASEMEAIARSLLRLTNALRDEAGLAPLAWSDELARIARSHSNDMARRGYFAHVAPGGGDLASRAATARFGYRSIRENLFFVEGRGDVARDATGHWMGSRGHRENLLDAEVTSTGAGVATGSGGGIYVTQLYANPIPNDAGN